MYAYINNKHWLPVPRVMAGSEDDDMKMEMSPLLEHLTMSGQHVLLATQKLSIEPEVTEHREELIEATQNVLLGVVKVRVDNHWGMSNHYVFQCE